MIDKREEIIISILKIRDCTASVINNKLPKELQYTSKTWNVQLSKKLSRMVKQNLIEKKKKKKYSIKKTKEDVAQLEGTLFNLNLGTTLFSNREKILLELSRSRKNKKNTIDDDYTKSIIEYLGIYLFTMLIRSYDVPMIMRGNKLKKSRSKKDNVSNSKKYDNLRRNWLSKALSLEEGVLKTSSIFNDLIVEFADFISQYDKSNQIEKPSERFYNAKQRMVNSFFEHLYPQTSKIILNTIKKSDKNLNYLKGKSNADPKLSNDLLEILTKNSTN